MVIGYGKIPESRPLPRQLLLAHKVTKKTQLTRFEEEISKPSYLRESLELDFPSPVQEWKGMNSLEEDEELMPDIISFKESGDSFEEAGSTSFHGVSHPPEPVDTDFMKGPILEDLSIRIPNIKASPSLLSPSESLVEEPNDLVAVASLFSVPRPLQNIEASPLPDSEKECIWDASFPPSGNVSPHSSIDSNCVAMSMSIVNTSISTHCSDGMMSDGMLSVERNYESTKGSIRGDSLESTKTSLSRASGSSGLSDENNWSNTTGSANKPHKGNDPRWNAILAIRARDGILGMSHFRLLKRLGCGDIGSVYLSELSATRCFFAMKVMDKASLANRKKLTRIQTEREILQLLDHPFLPTLYTYLRQIDSHVWSWNIVLEEICIT